MGVKVGLGIKLLQKKIDAFEFWCYRRMLEVSYVDRVTNNEVIKRMHTELHFRKDMWRRKMEFVGHVLRGSSGNSHLSILDGKVCGKRLRGRPRLSWTDDSRKWTKFNNFGVIVVEDKRQMENHDSQPSFRRRSSVSRDFTRLLLIDY